MRINTKYNKFIIPVIPLVVFVFCSFFVSAQTYGLKFHGQDVTLDKRTELNLTPDGFLKFQLASSLASSGWYSKGRKVDTRGLAASSVYETCLISNVHFLLIAEHFEIW